VSGAGGYELGGAAGLAGARTSRSSFNDVGENPMLVSQNVDACPAKRGTGPAVAERAMARVAPRSGKTTHMIKVKRRITKLVWVLLAVAVTTLAPLGDIGARAAGDADSLYVGDGTDNTVKRFDATTGAFLGDFVDESGGILRGPRGLVFDTAGNLVVSNQNVNESIRGEILQYSPLGELLRRLVPSSRRTAPAVPRGIILLQDVLYVAEFSAEFRDDRPVIPGRLLKYTAGGTFLGAFVPVPGSLGPDNEFHPRGVVLGPDGMIYVSNFPNLSTGLGGQVLRFDPNAAQFDPQPFITSSGGGGCNCTNDLNRPEGLVFGPAGDSRLFITSFQGNPNDTDKILIFQGPANAVNDSPGSYISQLELDGGGTQPRAFAQALLFGPDGFLFVPITGDGPDTGSVRKYNISANISPPPFSVLVPPRKANGPLRAPWYLTFGKTNPANLAYPGAGLIGGPDREICICADGTLLNICATLDCLSSAAQDAICGPACSAHGGESATGCIAADPSCPQ
jgi:DNA-binding beta-propeller fold protein YncE